MDRKHTDRDRPECIIAPVAGIGERRTYRGIVQPFAAHAHDRYVMGLVEEGARALECNGRTIDLLSGDVVVFNPGEVHACVQSDGGVFGYDSIAVEASFLDGAVLRGPRVSSAETREAFREVICAVDAKDDARTIASILHLCELLLEDAPGAQPDHAHDGAAERVMAHFRGHLSAPEPLGELAKREGLSISALIRAYRSRFAITPMRHLASLRVECACRLLAEGVSPSAVATEVGFADQPHLTRTFKQRMGLTPAAYQRMIRAEGARG